MKRVILKELLYCVRFLTMGRLLAVVFIALFCQQAAADTASLPLLTSKTINGGITYSLDVKVLMVMAALTVLPAILMTMTAFTRIIIVFSILRQALGITNVPSNQIIIGLSLIMTVYVMMPILTKVNDASLQPYLSGQMTEEHAIETAGSFIKVFMLKQTRKADLNMFSNLAHHKISGKNHPFFILMPAFITSELKTAFQIGFLIFLPFLVIDLVTASVLMSMGMMMLSPMVISLPFKILFFVMVDGWALMVTSLISSFRI
ncbi:MAG: flagellar type III secretion system pore protein FliP [Legionellales bacterium]